MTSPEELRRQFEEIERREAQEILDQKRLEEQWERDQRLRDWQFETS